MAKDERELLEEIASERGHAAPSDLSDDELVEYVTH